MLLHFHTLHNLFQWDVYIDIGGNYCGSQRVLAFFWLPNLCRQIFVNNTNRLCEYDDGLLMVYFSHFLDDTFLYFYYVKLPQFIFFAQLKLVVDCLVNDSNCRVGSI